MSGSLVVHLGSGLLMRRHSIGVVPASVPFPVLVQGLCRPCLRCRRMPGDRGATLRGPLARHNRGIWDTL
eukprot:983557-Alexandrium_andersonii.AAC.1